MTQPAPLFSPVLCLYHARYFLAEIINLALKYCHGVLVGGLEFVPEGRQHPLQRVTHYEELLVGSKFLQFVLAGCQAGQKGVEGVPAGDILVTFF